MEFTIFMNTIAILINMASWISGTALTVYTLYYGFKNGIYLKCIRRAAYLALLTYVDFQTVRLVQYLLGGAMSTTIGVSTAVSCGAISLCGIFLRSKAGTLMLVNWLKSKSRID